MCCYEEPPLRGSSICETAVQTSYHRGVRIYVRPIAMATVVDAYTTLTVVGLFIQTQRIWLGAFVTFMSFCAFVKQHFNVRVVCMYA